MSVRHDCSRISGLYHTDTSLLAECALWIEETALTKDAPIAMQPYFMRFRG
ncbi:MAG: hypothetical protein JRJ14_07410 [Deltaproteobacteria bacterium]|nr:hypothetical protein [Deltaproteobacteria bacterium]